LDSGKVRAMGRVKVMARATPTAKQSATVMSMESGYPP